MLRWNEITKGGDYSTGRGELSFVLPMQQFPAPLITGLSIACLYKEFRYTKDPKVCVDRNWDGTLCCGNSSKQYASVDGG
ncbi:hypothetical protein [Cyclobacterium xiamenense]|uniref:hypothetical protein n=1 Tax=Cyclobacterium xiamenense TaxID=1297121 RepID=UPI0012B95EEC|nr:hypothetical protein [Cyclobacterium xiamenense]